MSAVITRIAKAILEDQGSGIDSLEDMETTVKLVITGIYACGLVVAEEMQTFVLTRAVEPFDWED